MPGPWFLKYARAIYCAQPSIRAAPCDSYRQLRSRNPDSNM